MLSFNCSEINQNLAARYEHKPKLRLHIYILFFPLVWIKLYERMAVILFNR